MADNVSKYVHFLEKLTLQTKNNEINWEYLDENVELFSKIGLQDTFLKSKLFDSNNSFYVYIPTQNVYLVLFIKKTKEPTSELTLYIVPDTFKDIMAFKDDKFGEKLIILLNVVKSQFPNAEDFIDNFLAE